MDLFQSTPPARGATPLKKSRMTENRHFNPRPPRGGRPGAMWTSTTSGLFQSTPPARGATSCISSMTRELMHFNPRPPRGGRRSGYQYEDLRLVVISIHAPREGGDNHHINDSAELKKFQSTPPARGATATASTAGASPCNFNPRPPRGGRLYQILFSRKRKYFNPRPPRGGRQQRAKLSSNRYHFNPRPPRGGRLSSWKSDIQKQRFQSTPPARGATHNR